MRALLLRVDRTPGSAGRRSRAHLQRRRPRRSRSSAARRKRRPEEEVVLSWRISMKAYGFGISAARAIVAGIGVGWAQTSPASVDGLVSAAKDAAGLEWPGTFLRLCIVPPPATSRGAAGGVAAPAGPPAKNVWYAEPAKVADNLYFLGTKIHSAWALVGSQGIIVLEALFDYAAPDEIAMGMRKLGLEINQVKYVVISHAH